MKPENCIEVKHVNSLSVPYLSRFFGSAGTVLKVQKEEVSKYVTIQFANKSSVEKAFRFSGRVLDQCPIKIRRCAEKPSLELKLPQEQTIPQMQTNSSPMRLTSQSLWSGEDIWTLIQAEIKPHRFEQGQHMTLSMLMWSLFELLITNAKHIAMFKVPMRFRYLRLELEKLIIDRITRKNSKVIALTDSSRMAVLERKDKEALLWFNVPFPNIEEEQSKIEADSLITKCYQTIRDSLSLRLSEMLLSLHAASLCDSPEETGTEGILKEVATRSTTEEDSFIGVVENLGCKNVFFQYLVYEVPNTCIYWRDYRTLKTLEASLRLKGCFGKQLKDSAWCSLYRGRLTKKTYGSKKIIYSIDGKQKVQSLSLDEQLLVFENGQFTLQHLQEQLKLFRQSIGFRGAVFYLAKELTLQKYHQFLNIYEDQILKIEEEVEQVQIQDKPSVPKQEEVPDRVEIISEIVLIEIKSEHSSACISDHMTVNNLKLTHYLEAYVQDSVLAKGLIIASREMAIKLASNIIEREKDTRLFEFANRKYEQYVGEELWRVYSRQGERKAKNLLAKYARERT